MIPSITIPNTFSPAVPQLESVVGVPTETSAVARLPFYAVPSSVPAVQVYHNGRGTGSYDPLRRAAAPILSAPPTGLGFPAYQAPGAGVYVGTSFTSIFMTQMLGQPAASTAKEDAGLISTFFSAPVLGGMPAENVSPLAKNVREAAAPIVPEAALSEPLPSTIKIPLIQQLSSGLSVASSFYQPPVFSGPRAAETNQLRAGSSFIRPRGIDGYIATSSRNQFQLTPTQVEPIRFVV